MKIRFQFIYFDIAFIIIGSLLVITVLSLPTVHTEFVPQAVTGLATVSGILVATIGFWLNHSLKDVETLPKKWLSVRFIVIILVILFGIISVVGSLTNMVYGDLNSSYHFSILGVSLIVMVLFEIMFFNFYMELHRLGL